MDSIIVLGIILTDEPAGEGMTTTTVDGVNVDVTRLSRSLAGDDVMENIHPMFVEDSEIPGLGNHAGQILVTASVFGDANACDIVRAHARTLRQEFDEHAVGYVIHGTTFGPRFVRRALAQEVPVDLYAPVWLWEGEQGVTGYTCGLHRLGLPEIQVVDASTNPVEVYEALRRSARQAVEGKPVGQGSGKPWLIDASVVATELERLSRE